MVGANDEDSNGQIRTSRVDGVRVALVIHGADGDRVLFGVDTVLATCSSWCTGCDAHFEWCHVVLPLLFTP
jgi:hypothetical protein